MELPKNITQIGETNRNCKIYVEDYVVSYIKQLNQLASNKDMAVALYGKRRMDKDVTYLFVYGACKLDFLQRETRHLSQAQQQEIERLRRKYFAEYEFQGYRLLNGEMVEGFHICEQNICRYIEGYAQFYEKNDSMLTYMLEVRPVEAEPEKVNQEKYDMVKKRQEERRGEYYHEEYKRGDCQQEEPSWVQAKEETAEGLYAGEEAKLREKKADSASGRMSSKTDNKNMWKVHLSTAAVFCLLCAAGLAMIWDEESADELQGTVRQMVSELTEQKLPDAETLAENDSQVSTLMAQDKLTEALQNENAVAQVSGTAVVGTTSAPEAGINPTPAPDASAAPTPAPEVSTAPTPVPDASAAPTPAPEVSTAPTPVPVVSVAPTQEPAVKASASYVIQRGDTLIGICVRQYGSEAMVARVCEVNDIDDPDDIKMGQKILLP